MGPQNGGRHRQVVVGCVLSKTKKMLYCSMFIVIKQFSGWLFFLYCLSSFSQFVTLLNFFHSNLYFVALNYSKSLFYWKQKNIQNFSLEATFFSLWFWPSFLLHFYNWWRCCWRIMGLDICWGCNPCSQ
jgi:hypothetical protein